MNFFGKKESLKTVKDGPIMNTSGYDFHYVIPIGEELIAQELREAAVKYIDSKLPINHVYLDNHKQFNVPVGPWKKPMWQIQISTVKVGTSLSDPEAIAEDKAKTNYEFMLDLAAFLKSEIGKKQLKGSLLIHANLWPYNSNQRFERELHYDKSWLVCGDPVSFIDIWGCSKGLIELEESIKQQLGLNQSDSEIKKYIISEFKNGSNFSEQQIERFVSLIINAQHHLNTMQQKLSGQGVIYMNSLI